MERKCTYMSSRKVSDLTGFYVEKHLWQARFMAVVCMLMFHCFDRFLLFFGVCRPSIVNTLPFPYTVIYKNIHDCRFAVFRRGAVCQRIGESWPMAKSPRHGQPVTD